MQKIKILVSSIGLPSKAIGSWVIRIQQFQENLNYFDYVLSPTTSPDNRYIFCEKEQHKSWYKVIRKTSAITKRAESYLLQIKQLSSKGKPLQILVMDDRALLDAIALIKPSLPKGSELIFSFHGHSLSLTPWCMDQVDKLFFLTYSGYKASLASNYQFSPQCFIVGNGVLGEQFHPLKAEENTDNRVKMGFNPDDLILIWMANSRPVKGLHIFKKLVPLLYEKYLNLRVISIGHEKDTSITHDYWTQMGRLPHNELPGYLQLGDIYVFTSLWQEGFGLSLAEAVKCGNWALAASSGGIPEVLQDCPKSVLVKNPNFIESWLVGFEELMEKRQSGIDNPEEYNEFLKTWHSYEKWQENYLKALMD